MKRKPVEAPHSEEAERAVLGGLMLDNSLLAQVTSQLEVEHFFDERHRGLYRVMIMLHGQGSPVDPLTLRAATEQLGEPFDMGYVATLDLDLPDIGRFDSYVDIVKERATRRELIKLAEETIARSGGADELVGTLGALQDAVPRLLGGILRKRTERLADIMPSLMADLEDRPEALLCGIPTLFSRYDELTGGLHKGHLVIVAGRPGLGKSAFALNVVQNIAIRQGLPIGIFSMEMTAQELALRMLCSEADVPVAMLRANYLSQAAWARLVKASRLLASAPIFVDDTSCEMGQIEVACRRLCREEGIVAGVLDYLQLIFPRKRRENRNAEVSEISRGLKQLAKELGIPLMVLCQLNREVTRRADHRPELADLRDSGAIESDADLVAFVHRPAAFDPLAEKSEAELLIKKARHGETGTVPLQWIGETTTFRPPALDAGASCEDPF